MDIRENILDEVVVAFAGKLRVALGGSAGHSVLQGTFDGFWIKVIGMQHSFGLVSTFFNIEVPGAQFRIALVLRHQYSGPKDGSALPFDQILFGIIFEVRPYDLGAVLAVTSIEVFRLKTVYRSPLFKGKAPYRVGCAPHKIIGIAEDVLAVVQVLLVNVVSNLSRRVLLGIGQ